MAFMADGLLEAVCGLWLARLIPGRRGPGLDPKPLLAKLREQQPPDLGADNNRLKGRGHVAMLIE